MVHIMSYYLFVENHIKVIMNTLENIFINLSIIWKE